MGQLELDVLKKILAEQIKTNEHLNTLINIQQPIKEVVSNTNKIRGNQRGNAERQRSKAD